MPVTKRKPPPDALQKLVYQAKALMLCGLPHEPLEAKQYRRSLGLSRGAQISVTYKTTGEVLPYGNDRYLLAWLQDKADDRGFVSIEHVSQYFELFDVSGAGKNYGDFEDRIERLRGLVVSIDVKGGRSKGFLDIKLIEAGLTGNDEDDRALLKRVHAGDDRALGQLEIFQQARYGFLLHPTFMRYYRNDRVPVPLALMQRLYRKYMQWDYAQFVLYRSYNAESPSRVPWEAVVDVIDCSDSNKRRVRLKLEEVHEMIRDLEGYGDFPAEFDEGYGLHVERWRPPVSSGGRT